MAAIPDPTILEALRKVRTSNQWSLLEGVARKMGIKTAVLHEFLDVTDDETLRVNGVWKCRVGDCYIVCTNPGYRTGAQSGRDTCSCVAGGGEESGGEERAAERFFGSMDYNAGRHVIKKSGHQTTCAVWKPPSTSHLHSWRRGYQK